MKTSCVPHPTNEPLVIIHKWQLVYFENDVVQAALFSHFEYWHNIKLDLASRAKESSNANLIQYHTEKQLIDGIMGIVKSKMTIRKAVNKLIKCGILEIVPSHNALDKTRHFIFHPESVESWLNGYRSTSAKISSSKSQNCLIEELNLAPRKAKNSSSNKVTEITTETTTEKTTTTGPKIKKAPKKSSFSFDSSRVTPSQKGAFTKLLKELTSDAFAEYGDTLAQMIVDSVMDSQNQGKITGRFSGYVASIVKAANEHRFTPLEPTEPEETDPLNCKYCNIDNKMFFVRKDKTLTEHIDCKHGSLAQKYIQSVKDKYGYKFVPPTCHPKQENPQLENLAN
jgi:hypothetical protein